MCTVIKYHHKSFTTYDQGDPQPHHHSASANCDSTAGSYGTAVVQPGRHDFILRSPLINLLSVI